MYTRAESQDSGGFDSSVLFILRDGVGDSNNIVRGYCLDSPRFEELPNNTKTTFGEQGNSQAHREFPGSLESTNLSRDYLSPIGKLGAAASLRTQAYS